MLDLVVGASGGDEVEEVDEEVVGFGVACYGEEGFGLTLVLGCVLLLLLVLAGLEDDVLEGGGGRGGVEV